VKLVADTRNIADGEPAKITIFRTVGDKTEEVTTIEGTVNNNRVEVEWEVEDYNETETETEAAATATPTDEATDVRPEKKLRAVDVYWTEPGRSEQNREVVPDRPVDLYLVADNNYTAGDEIHVKIHPSQGKNFSAGNSRGIDVSGYVDANGIAKIQNFEINYKPQK
jgi:hypothetical protein